MEERKSIYRIVRQERMEDREEIRTEGLRIGCWQGCELWLNHPSVSNLHAGIKEVDGQFYVTDLSPSNSTKLNGRLIVFSEPEALADGDVLQLGPFFLELSRLEGALEIKVSHQPGCDISDDQPIQVSVGGEIGSNDVESRTASPELAHSLAEFWEKRSRIKVEPKTLLHPQKPPPAGKSRFHWKPNSDLVRSWPLSIFVWLIVVIGVVLLALAQWYPTAYSSGPVSVAHARSNLIDAHPVARQPNAGACLTCHTRQGSINESCSSCHQTTEFAARITPAHRLNHIDCVKCHAEHRGTDFNSLESAVNMCVDCHRDGNIFNGVRMKTPHATTRFGYPVVNGEWVWKGLDAEELALKPEIARQRVTTKTEQEWRKVQFHALHGYRILAKDTIEGIRDEVADNGVRNISCSTCHLSSEPLDRVTPRTTCINCHNTQIFEPTTGLAKSTSTVSCTSCHVQHIPDKQWRPAIFLDAPRPANWRESLNAK